MKFKLFQIVTLLIFVVSIVFMTQTPNGFGGEPQEHPSAIYVNPKTGHRQTPPEDIEPSELANWDPRGRSFPNRIICGTNGGESVNGRGWYYEGGKLSNPQTHADNETHPANDPRWEQNVSRINLYTDAFVNKNTVTVS